MSRFLLLFIVLMLYSFSSFCQVDTDKSKTGNPQVGTRNYIDPLDTVIENKLVALAMKSPGYDGTKHQNRINELELSRAKSSWLNLLVISGSYYDQSANKQVTGQTTFVYPKYYFSLSVPLGIIFSQGASIKSAREGIALSKDRQEEMSRTIKSDVLSKYKQYRLYGTLIDMQNEMVNDVLAAATQVEDNFKKGQVSVNEYINSQKIRNEELAKIMNLKLQQDLIKLEIEKMIGVPLDEVLHRTVKK